MRALAVGLLTFALVGCASPSVTATPTPASTQAPRATVKLSPSTPLVIMHVAITCPVIASSGHGAPARPDNCPGEEAAALAAVASIEYTVASLIILPAGFGCASFYPGPAACFIAVTGPAAYVTFVGTKQVAAVKLRAVLSRGF